MGLDIMSQSDKDYHYSYSGIHYIRYMAYKSIGGTDDYTTWHDSYYGKWGETAPATISGKYAEAQEKFKNLYLHSDCDGKYTPKGRIGTEASGLQTGNSIKLLKELEYIKSNLPHKEPVNADEQFTDRDWYVFNMFYDLVEDVVNNYDGVLEFH